MKLYTVLYDTEALTSVKHEYIYNILDDPGTYSVPVMTAVHVDFPASIEEKVMDSN